MRYKERSSSSIPAVTGASSLLVIFSVLCLTVFALLSLSTVTADHRISEENMDASSKYYEAEYKANEILSQLRSGNAPEGVRFLGSEEAAIQEAFERAAVYAVKIDEDQVLQVRVQLRGAEYMIEQWQVISTADWEPDTDLPVWIGD